MCFGGGGAEKGPMVDGRVCWAVVLCPDHESVVYLACLN
jgi:hypothetical protein